MKVLVTGATGFVGQVVVRQLLDGGHDVVVLTRHVPKAAMRLGARCEYHQWVNVHETLPPLEAFQGVDAIINLMGESIGQGQWSDQRKKLLSDSRVLATRQLVAALRALGPAAPKTLVSTSAVGLYGPHENEELTEQSPGADDFLGRLCQDWEQEALAAAELGTRVAIIRVGLVLGRGGGALAKMLTPFKLGVGGPLGTGKQWMSWIHVEDLAAMYIRAAKEASFKGVYNGTAPYPTTNEDFTKTLGKTLKRPTVLPAPAFALRFLFGEMSTILLEGQRVVPKRMHDEAHFHYRYPTLEMALKETAY